MPLTADRIYPLLIVICLAAFAFGCKKTDDASPAPMISDTGSDSSSDTAPDLHFDRDPPPEDMGIYGYASGCYSMEGFDGTAPPGHLAPAGQGSFSFSQDTPEAASRFRMRATDLATYLFYDQQAHYLVAQEVTPGSGQWQLARVQTLDSDVLLKDDSFVSPAEWVLEPSQRAPGRYQLKHYQTGMYMTLDGLTADPASAAEITLFAHSQCASFPELTIDATGSVQPRQWPDGDVYGIAEIHSHVMTNFGFGGSGIFHGAPFHRLGVEHALPDCEPFHGDGGRRDVVGYFYDVGFDLDVGTALPIITNGASEEFNHFTQGYPEFTAWPRSWGTSTHQTMYYRWIERAYLSGLRLLVQHATSNSVLCEFMTAIGSQQQRYSCNDMVGTDRSIREVRNLERYIDAQWGGPGKGWFRVVETPQQAREVINAGKMAVVLGIEVSNLFDCFLTTPEGFEPCTQDSVSATLDRYWELGVRAIFPVHKYDNAFTAGDGSGGIIELGNFINTGHYSSFVDDCPGISTSFDKGGVTFGGLNEPRDVYGSPAPADMSGFAGDPLGTLVPFLTRFQEPGLEGQYCQKHGLTPLGRSLIQELMARGMLIDIAHLPQRSLEQTYQILEENNYPATKTHGNSNEGRLFEIGGLTGVGLGRCADPERPGNMADGLRAHVQNIADAGGYPADGLAFDLNGFAGGPRPRFGDESRCSEPQPNPMAYPFTSYDGNVTFERPNLGDREVDFDTEGMIHIGLLPELIEDVRRNGVTDEDLEPLFRSAESYIRMWERAEERGAQIRAPGE